MRKELDMLFIVELREFLAERLGPDTEVLTAEIGSVVQAICRHHGYIFPVGPHRDLQWKPDTNVHSSVD